MLFSTPSRMLLRVCRKGLVEVGMGEGWPVVCGSKVTAQPRLVASSVHFIVPRLSLDTTDVEWSLDGLSISIKRGLWQGWFGNKRRDWSISSLRLIILWNVCRVMVIRRPCFLCELGSWEI